MYERMLRPTADPALEVLVPSAGVGVVAVVERLPDGWDVVTPDGELVGRVPGRAHAAELAWTFHAAADAWQFTRAARRFHRPPAPDLVARYLERASLARRSGRRGRWH